MAMHQPKPLPSLFSQVLKDYRKAHNITQEQLASDLCIEPRTLRSWENERPLENIRELRRIADLLGIEPEKMGLAASLSVPRSPDQIEEIMKHVWHLLEVPRLNESRSIIERLILNLQSQSSLPKDTLMLRTLARAYHTAGYVVSEATRTSESHEAIHYYAQMEMIARELDDHTLLNISLTYQGDMFRRLGNISKAISYLEAARDTTPYADTAARGNGIQLLGRAYLRNGELSQFERTMAEAEELAATFDPMGSSTQGHYSIGTVYEEYGRSYADLRQIQKALDYLDHAQQTLPSTKFWELLVATSRAETLVKGGEFRAGIQLAIEAAREIQVAGILRYLERIYGIKQYLEKLTWEIGQISMPLREVLDGGEYREI